jgi:hypothetical protein
MNGKAVALASMALGLLVAPAAAHHSFAMFDHAKTNRLAGTVKEVEWINPHVWIHLTMAGPAAKPVTWSFEAGGPGQLTGWGWVKDAVKAGDRVELSYHPLKDGSHGGQILNVMYPDGRSFCGGGCAGRGE